RVLDRREFCGASLRIRDAVGRAHLSLASCPTVRLAEPGLRSHRRLGPLAETVGCDQAAVAWKLHPQARTSQLEPTGAIRSDPGLRTGESSLRPGVPCFRTGNQAHCR